VEGVFQAFRIPQLIRRLAVACGLLFWYWDEYWDFDCIPIGFGPILTSTRSGCTARHYGIGDMGATSVHS
jgi:hypothetical protein